MATSRTTLGLAIALSTTGIAAQGSNAKLSFTMKNAEISVGQRPRVVFNAPLPPVKGERYWITFCKKGAPDSSYGRWQYVKSGVKEVTLKSARQAGQFELRLHAGYPRLQYNVVCRQAFTIQPNAAPGRSGRARRAKRSASEKPASDKLQRGSTLRWKGKKGDASKTPFTPKDWTSPDIVEVGVAARNREVTITLTFAADVETVLQQKTPKGEMVGHVLGEMYFDVDNNNSTGKKLGMAPRRKGFDLGIEINTGLKLRSGKTVAEQFGSCMSIPGSHEVLGTPVAYYTNARSKLGRKIRSASKARGSTKKGVSIEGNKLVVRIPCKLLGLRSGSAVRVCFLDSTKKPFSGDKVTPDAHLVID